MSAEGAAQSVEIFVAQLVAALRVAVEEAADNCIFNVFFKKYLY